MGQMHPHLPCLHFTDNKNEPDMMDENSDQLWMTWNLFEILNQIFSKFYSPSVHLAADEVSLKHKGRVIFWQYIYPRNTNVSESKFTNYVMRLDTRGTTAYSGRDRQQTVQHLTITHTTVSKLTRKIQGYGHKLYMDNYFSCSDLLDDLATKQI